MSNVAETTLATQVAAFSTCNEKAHALREVTATIVTRPAGGILTNRFSGFLYHSSLQGLMDNNNRLDFLSFLYAKMVSQLVRPYTTLFQKLGMIS